MRKLLRHLPPLIAFSVMLVLLIVATRFTREISVNREGDLVEVGPIGPAGIISQDLVLPEIQLLQVDVPLCVRGGGSKLRLLVYDQTSNATVLAVQRETRAPSECIRMVGGIHTPPRLDSATGNQHFLIQLQNDETSRGSIIAMGRPMLEGELPLTTFGDAAPGIALSYRYRVGVAVSRLVKTRLIESPRGWSIVAIAWFLAAFVSVHQIGRVLGASFGRWREIVVASSISVTGVVATIWLEAPGFT